LVLKARASSRITGQEPALDLLYPRRLSLSRKVCIVPTVLALPLQTGRGRKNMAM
jgi:hypothetical protein